MPSIDTSHHHRHRSYLQRTSSSNIFAYGQRKRGREKCGSSSSVCVYRLSIVLLLLYCSSSALNKANDQAVTSDNYREPGEKRKIVKVSIHISGYLYLLFSPHSNGIQRQGEGEREMWSNDDRESSRSNDTTAWQKERLSRQNTWRSISPWKFQESSRTKIKTKRAAHEEKRAVRTVRDKNKSKVKCEQKCNG